MKKNIVHGDENVRLSVREYPAENKPTVVLIHGYPDDQTVWDGVIAELRDQYHLITYDVRGIGESDIPSRVRDYKHQKLAADFVAVLDALAPNEKVHLVGHDWGSVQSWYFVNQPYIAKRIASYTSISGPGLDYAGHLMRRKLSRPTPKNLWAVIKQLLMSWYTFAFHIPLLGPFPWRLGLAGHWFKVVSWLEGKPVKKRPTQKADAINGMQLYRANILPSLFKPQPFKVTVPVLLIVPQQDRFLSPSTYDDLPVFVRQLQRVSVTGGHWLPLSQPELLAGQVNSFIQQQG
ncbi:MAG: alpha/beta fold hydrolase [Gammaproteobacteria bacterium]|nr:alpha/beta fold hydrolase [Gammaproteobacteria bacterium]